MSNNRDFRSIVADSGPLMVEYGLIEIPVPVWIPGYGEPTIPIPMVPNPWKTQDRARLNGFTDDQWDWIRNTAEGQDHVFFFTHGRIVGGGEEQRGRMVDYTEDFVEWSNQDDVNVRAVFVGHSHVNRGYGDEPDYMITSENIDSPRTFSSISATIPFDWYTVYIETESSTDA